MSIVIAQVETLMGCAPTIRVLSGFGSASYLIHADTCAHSDDS